MAPDLPDHVTLLLEEAVKNKIENLEIIQNEVNAKGQGFLGEVTFISLKNKVTGEEYHLVVKQVLSSGTDNTLDLMSSSYSNEIYMYTKVMPAFKELQRSYTKAEDFSFMPKCYAVDRTIKNEKLVLENLKHKNYQLHPKKVPLNLEMYKKIFNQYGKLHGLSFAFKHHQQEKFFQLAAPLKNIFKKMFDMSVMQDYILMVTKKVHAYFEEDGEQEIAKTLEKYVTDGCQIFLNTQNYQGDYGIIVHGDCWSNNLMFKYKENDELEDIKFLDWQLSNIQSPVQDLSYSLYSGADKDTLDKLEILQKIYHESLKETLKQYELDVNEMYPFEALKKEWAEFSIFGYIMGIVIWQTKTVQDVEEIPALNDILDNKHMQNPNVLDFKVDERIFKEATKGLSKHMYENGYF